jgi:hypothetical protein
VVDARKATRRERTSTPTRRSSPSTGKPVPRPAIEHLLLKTGVSIGLLSNHTELRLVYKPAGENSGHVTFGVANMVEVAGRPIFAALQMLLSAERVFGFGIEPKHRLANILAESRKYQNVISTKLAEHAGRLCQRSSVSGVTMESMVSSALRPAALALAAKRRFWSSLNRRRLPGTNSRTDLTQDWRYSITFCCSRLIHPDRQAGMTYRGERITFMAPSARSTIEFLKIAVSGFWSTGHRFRLDRSRICRENRAARLFHHTR